MGQMPWSPIFLRLTRLNGSVMPTNLTLMR